MTDKINYVQKQLLIDTMKKTPILSASQFNEDSDYAKNTWLLIGHFLEEFGPVKTLCTNIGDKWKQIWKEISAEAIGCWLREEVLTNVEHEIVKLHMIAPFVPGYLSKDEDSTDYWYKEFSSIDRVRRIEAYDAAFIPVLHRAESADTVLISEDQSDDEL